MNVNLDNIIYQAKTEDESKELRKSMEIFLNECSIVSPQNNLVIKVKTGTPGYDVLISPLEHCRIEMVQSGRPNFQGIFLRATPEFCIVKLNKQNYIIHYNSECQPLIDRLKDYK